MNEKHEGPERLRDLPRMLQYVNGGAYTTRLSRVAVQC